ncbi:hypothetical protein U1Q18_002345 [Sarracenia purpurea var. burkii]
MAIDGHNRIKESKSFLILPRTSLASVESLTIPLVQEVVLLADFQCAQCRKKVDDIISKLNVETESVELSVVEKKVTLTCRSYSRVVKVPALPVAAVRRKPPNKVAMISRLFRSSRS